MEFFNSVKKQYANKKEKYEDLNSSLQLYMNIIDVLQGEFVEKQLLDKCFQESLTDTLEFYKNETDKIFKHQGERDLEPNYKMLNKIVKYAIERSQIVNNKLRTECKKDGKLDSLNIQVKTLIFISRMRMICEMLFFAGIMDHNDIWCQKFDSLDWQLIQKSTVELQADEPENLLQRKAENDKSARALLVATMKNLKALSGKEEELSLNTSKIINNTTDFDLAVDNTGMNQFPRINWRILSNIKEAKAKQNTEKTHEEWELVLAAPSYKAFGNLAYTVTRFEPKSFFITTFIKDCIATNYKIYLRPNVMKDIFYVDPYDPERRPVVLRDSAELKVNALDILPPDIFSKNNDYIAIRIVSRHWQKAFKRNFGNDKIYSTKFDKNQKQESKSAPLDSYEPNPHAEKYKDLKIQQSKDYKVMDYYIEGEQSNRGNIMDFKDRKLVVENLNDIMWIKPKHESLFETVIIHIHGGAFIAAASGHMQNVFFPWVKELDVPIFSIDYRLAPYAQYPYIINDGINAYVWIIYFLTVVIKANVKNLILTGDSAGGTMANSILNWTIVNKFRKPDYVFFHSTCVSCNLSSFTPSFFYAFSNPTLNYATLKMSAHFFFKNGVDATTDCYANPLGTPDWVLQEYPKIDFGIAELDPLRDDEYRLAFRLQKLGNKLKIIQMRQAAHDPICNANTNKDANPEDNCYNDFVIERLRDWILKRYKAEKLKSEIQLAEDEEYVIEFKHRTIRGATSVLKAFKPIDEEKLSISAEASIEQLMKEVQAQSPIRNFIKK